MKLIAQGAEAKLYEHEDYIIKDRIKKSYRVSEIDSKLRIKRTRREAKILQKLEDLNFPAPRLKETDNTTKIICTKLWGDKIAEVLYKLLYNMHIKHFFHSKWVCCIEKLLNGCGLSEYWLTQNVPKNVLLSKIVKQRLCDQFKQSWSDSVFTSAKCLNYRIFKCLHQFESYLVQLPYDLRKAYCNYRCLNHRLPIE